MICWGYTNRDSDRKLARLSKVIPDPELLLVATVAAVGVLHTMVPDHWVPIALLARQRGWSKAQTARAAFQASAGHILSTLLIAVIAWLAEAAVAARFGHLVDSAASVALVAFGGWVAVSAWRELAHERAHGHAHEHGHAHQHGHEHKAGQRTALFLILRSSPMVEGRPAFFAAGRYGVGLISIMALVFGVTTIATYIVLSVYSGAGLQKIGLGRFERYGEVFTGAFVMLVGAIFWFWSVLLDNAGLTKHKSTIT